MTEYNDRQEEVVFEVVSAKMMVTKLSIVAFAVTAVQLPDKLYQHLNGVLSSVSVFHMQI